MIGSSDNDAATVAASWRPILPNRQLANVCSFEQTAVDDPAKISEKPNGCIERFCFAKMHDD
jgi:hypothetical protein